LRQITYLMKIRILEIINQTRQILIYPKNFWTTNKEEFETSGNVFTGFLFPIVLTTAAAVLIGDFLRRSDFILEIPLFNSFRIIALFVLQYLISVFLTNELIKTFEGQKNIYISRNLVAYSMTPLLLIFTLTSLIPFLRILNIIGFYSFYIYWVGVEELLVFPENKKSKFSLITIVVNLFLFSFLSIFLSKLLIAYY